MFSYELQVAYFPVKQSSLYNNMEYPTCHFYFLGIHTSLRTQTYFRLSLVSAENNVCKPEPGNDFCNVMAFVSPWPIRFHDRRKLECSSQQIPRAVVLGLLELNCDWLKILTSQKSFPGSGSQTFFSAETSDSRKYVCVRRLYTYSPRDKKFCDHHNQCDVRAEHDGKVGCNTVEYTTTFLYSDRLYFLWHGINREIDH